MVEVCPVNFQTVNGNQIRIQAALVALTASIFLATEWTVVILLLVFDFALRTFSSARLSPFTHLSIWILTIFNIQNRPVDSAPKIFASKLGLTFSITIATVTLLGYINTANVIAIVLIASAALDAMFNICVGCKVYTLLRHLKVIPV